MTQKTVITKLVQSVTDSFCKVCQVLQSVTDCYCKVRHNTLLHAAPYDTNIIINRSNKMDISLKQLIQHHDLYVAPQIIYTRDSPHCQNSDKSTIDLTFSSSLLKSLILVYH